MEIIKDITISIDKLNIVQLYSDWRWLLNVSFNPIMMSSFGDLFYQKEDLKIYFLDTIEGREKLISDNIISFNTFINNKENQRDFLLSDIVLLLKENDLSLKDNQCYSFIVPQVLGGTNDLDNIEISDISVWLSIIGQVHYKAKYTDEGTRIVGFETN